MGAYSEWIAWAGWSGEIFPATEEERPSKELPERKWESEEEEREKWGCVVALKHRQGKRLIVKRRENARDEG